MEVAPWFDQTSSRCEWFMGLGLKDAHDGSVGHLGLFLSNVWG